MSERRDQMPYHAPRKLVTHFTYSRVIFPSLEKCVEDRGIDVPFPAHYSERERATSTSQVTQFYTDNTSNHTSTNIAKCLRECVCFCAFVAKLAL